jgi:uncharacterized membrane protein YwaF
MAPLNRAQRLVMVIGLGFALYVLGQWLTSMGTNSNYGWVAFAPLSKQFAPIGGLHPWVQFLIWIVLTATWTFVSAALMKSDRPHQKN